MLLWLILTRTYRVQVFFVFSLFCINDNEDIVGVVFLLAKDISNDRRRREKKEACKHERKRRDRDCV